MAFTKTMWTIFITIIDTPKIVRKSFLLPHSCACKNFFWPNAGSLCFYTLTYSVSTVCTFKTFTFF